MNHEETRRFVLGALENAMGDDLYRAQRAFRGLTSEQMNQQYGESGKTRNEILAEYEAHRDRVQDAMDWVNRL